MIWHGHMMQQVLIHNKNIKIHQLFLSVFSWNWLNNEENKIRNITVTFGKNRKEVEWTLTWFSLTGHQHLRGGRCIKCILLFFNFFYYYNFFMTFNFSRKCILNNIIIVVNVWLVLQGVKFSFCGLGV